MHFLRQALFYIVLTTISISSTALAASLHISPSGSGSYSVQGTSMNGVAGIQIDITYNASQLSSPSAVKGALVGNAMFAANTTNNPIKIAIISTIPFSGNGTVAVLSFANSSNSAPTPTIVSYSMIDSTGAPITTNATISNSDSSLSTTPGIPFAENKPVAATPNTAPMPTAVSSSIPSVLGTVTMPGDSKETPPQKPVTIEPEAALQPVATEPSVATTVKNDEMPKEKIAEAEKQPEAVQTTTYSTVLDRFRAYKGEVSPLILTALFTKPIATNVVQEPAIAITNGNNTIKVTFTLKQDEKAAPNFALTGSKMISLVNSRENAGIWIVEALPNKNALTTTITMIAGNEIIEYPLVAVPPANGITDKETDFALFLKDTGAKNPKRDLNGDGVHDYQDNYIYTAYYLLLQKNKDKPKRTKSVVK